MISGRRLYQQLKNVYHFAQAHFWRAYYGWPDKKMKIYGITGTNGKTTTSILLGNILREQYGKGKVGLLTTIVFWFGDEEKINETKMTTMRSRAVFERLKKMKDRGVTYLVLEITSHALDQNRLAGIKLRGGIILNIAREHLDYHLNMKQYARAKAKIINYFIQGAPLVVSNRFPISNFRFSGVRLIEFSQDEAKGIDTPLAGEVNKENVLAASLLARELGITRRSIREGVKRVKQVPGRREWVEPQFSSTDPQFLNNCLPRVLVDYAVTPDALEYLYKEAKKQTNGKIFVVLGACGLRDRGKRPLMTKVAANYADEVVITREDPWTEDEEQIFSDLEEGLKNTRVVWSRIIDRRKAIKHCIEKAGSGDVVVVTGKGAEVGMAVGKKIIPWSDKEVIIEIMEELKNQKRGRRSITEEQRPDRKCLTL